MKQFFFSFFDAIDIHNKCPSPDFSCIGIKKRSIQGFFNDNAHPKISLYLHFLSAKCHGGGNLLIINNLQPKR